MKQKTVLQDLLQKRVDRKEFLRFSGVALLSIVGVSKILSSLELLDKNDKNSTGYGSSTYGR